MEIEEATIPLHSRAIRKIRSWHIIAVLILAVGAFAVHTWARASNGFLYVYALDVGQGDATLILTPDGHQILIDGGPDGSILSRLGRYIPSWDNNLDVVIATHRDSDHITGLVAVLERYDVAHIVTGFEFKDTAISKALDAAIQTEGADVIEGMAGMDISLGASTSLAVLYPYESREGTITRDANHDSLVMMLRHEQVHVLLTGDAEADVERMLVADSIPLDADILKAGHHGSKTSSTPEFISAVSPQAVIISAGRNNRYGHPHPSVIARLESFGIPYYRTDTQGDVTVTSDGRSFSITTQY